MDKKVCLALNLGLYVVFFLLYFSVADTSSDRQVSSFRTTDRLCMSQGPRHMVIRYTEERCLIPKQLNELMEFSLCSL